MKGNTLSWYRLPMICIIETIVDGKYMTLRYRLSLYMAHHCTDSCYIIAIRFFQTRSQEQSANEASDSPFTVDQLMWRTIVHHIPRWRKPSPFRDFMRRLWPFMLRNVDCMHVTWQIRCIWIAGHVVVWEIVRIQWFWGPWNYRQDVVDDSAGCGGRHEM